ncbi:MAG: hypothetical protein RJA61_559 [Candidatus Parcubacteria bacterium]
MTTEREDPYLIAAKNLLQQFPDGACKTSDLIRALSNVGIDGHSVKHRRLLETHLRQMMLRQPV